MIEGQKTCSTIVRVCESYQNVGSVESALKDSCNIKRKKKHKMRAEFFETTHSGKRTPAMTRDVSLPVDHLGVRRESHWVSLLGRYDERVFQGPSSRDLQAGVGALLKEGGLPALEVLRVLVLPKRNHDTICTTDCVFRCGFFRKSGLLATLGEK